MTFTVFKLLVTFVLLASDCTPSTATFKDNVHHPELISSSSLRVHNGRDIREGEYPYVVILFVLFWISEHHQYFSRFCTGSMISKNWVITAGHCVDYLDYKPYVWYGNHTISPLISKLFSEVLEVVLHPSYRVLPYKNDLGLLRVSDIDMQSYGRLSASDYSTMMGLRVTYVGGGTTGRAEDEEELLPLQVGEAAVIQCSSEFRGFARHLICATHRCSNNIFYASGLGDSGGPLLYDDRIIGVLSYGVGAVDGYTPISPYLDWIFEVTRPR